MPLPEEATQNAIKNRLYYFMALYTINHAYWLGIKGHKVLDKTNETEYFENLFLAKTIAHEGMYIAARLDNPLRIELGKFCLETKRHIKDDDYSMCYNEWFSDPAFSLIQQCNTVIMPTLLEGIDFQKSDQKNFVFNSLFFVRKIENLVKEIKFGGYVKKFGTNISKLVRVRNESNRRLAIRYSVLLDSYKQIFTVMLRHKDSFQLNKFKNDKELSFLLSQIIYAQISFSSGVLESMRC